MKTRRNVAALMLVAVLLFTCSPGTGKTPVSVGANAPQTRPGRGDQPNSAMINEAYGRLPLSFETSADQGASPVQFVSRSGGSATFLTPTEAVVIPADSDRAELPSRSPA